MARTLQIVVHEGQYGVARLAPDALLPAWAEGDFVSVTRTADELSIVAPEAGIPGNVESERGWRLLQVVGPLEFGEVGILAALAESLAAAAVSSLAVATYDTDYVLVRGEDLERAVEALRDAEHSVRA